MTTKGPKTPQTIPPEVATYGALATLLTRALGWAGYAATPAGMERKDGVRRDLLTVVGWLNTQPDGGPLRIGPPLTDRLDRLLGRVSAVNLGVLGDCDRAEARALRKELQVAQRGPCGLRGEADAPDRVPPGTFTKVTREEFGRAMHGGPEEVPSAKTLPVLLAEAGALAAYAEANGMLVVLVEEHDHRTYEVLVDLPIAHRVTALQGRPAVVPAGAVEVWRRAPGVTSPQEAFRLGTESIARAMARGMRGELDQARAAGVYPVPCDVPTHVTQGQLDALRREVKGLQTTADTTVAVHGNRLATLEARVGGARGDRDKLFERVDKLETALGTVMHETRLRLLEERAGVTNQRLTELELKVGAAPDKRLGELEGRMGAARFDRDRIIDRMVRLERRTAGRLSELERCAGLPAVK